mmetsp:Transcript_893/g.3313  ORF Transcript_893/g.3313 Transcript_893/m.3313 type:complete len:244 (-) Transcript_893:3044-3775(-)
MVLPRNLRRLPRRRRVIRRRRRRTPRVRGLARFDSSGPPPRKARRFDGGAARVGVRRAGRRRGLRVLRGDVRVGNLGAVHQRRRIAQRRPFRRRRRGRRRPARRVEREAVPRAHRRQRLRVEPGAARARPRGIKGARARVARARVGPDVLATVGAGVACRARPRRGDLEERVVGLEVVGPGAKDAVRRARALAPLRTWGGEGHDIETSSRSLCKVLLAFRRRASQRPCKVKCAVFVVGAVGRK